MYFHPASTGFVYSQETFPSQNGTALAGWHFQSQAQPAKGIVVQFHGNGENMSSHFLSVVWACKYGYDVFVFDYQGYGISAGEHSFDNARRDAIASFKFILNKRPDLPVILLGQSLGGNILLSAFSDFQPKGRIALVIIDSSYLSNQELAKHKVTENWFTWPFQPFAHLLISDRFQPKENLRRISPIPLLVVHGTRDAVIPLSFGREIFEAAAAPKYFWKIPKGRHIDAWIGHGGLYRKKLLELLDAVLVDKANH